MRRRSFAAISILLIIFLTSAIISDVSAKDKKKKGTVLSTIDIDEDYETLGLVHYRSSVLTVEKIDKELKKQAKKMGADYVVGIIYFSHSGYLYGSGTAVKLIDDDSKK